MYIVGRRLHIHPALGVQFLVVFCVAIELGPYGDHEAAVHPMHAVEHRLWVREAGGLKLVAAPLILRPVVPVLHDIVNGNVTASELSQRADNLILRLIALPTLPEAQHPLGIERGLARQRAVTADDLVEIVARNEVVVHILSHLAPDAQLFTLCLTARLSHTQAAAGLTAIRTPLDAQLHTLPLLQLTVELIAIRIPGSAPTLSHDLLPIDIHSDVAGIVENELVEEPPPIPLRREGELCSLTILREV